MTKKLTPKQRTEKVVRLLQSVKDATVESRANAIWAPLAQADLVTWTSKPNGTIDRLSLTEGGESFLRVLGNPKKP